MGYTDGRIGFIYMLPASAAGPVGIDTQIRLIYFDINIIANFRYHKYGGKRSMPSAVGIEWRNTHEAVHPRFGFKQTIGVLPFYHNCYTFNTGFIPGLIIDYFGFKTTDFGVTQIHTH